MDRFFDWMSRPFGDFEIVVLRAIAFGTIAGMLAQFGRWFWLSSL